MIEELAQVVSNGAGRHASVRVVFGEPVVSHGRTVLPVARVGFGFGSGGGQAEERTGGGGGGGGWAQAVGVVEIGPEGTRFVPVDRPLLPLALAAACLWVGFALGRHTGGG